MPYNPYQPPNAPLSPPSPPIPEDPVQQDLVKAAASIWPPATALVVLSALAMCLDLIIIGIAVSSDASMMLEEYGNKVGVVWIIGNIAANLLMMLVHLVVLLGAMEMCAVRDYSNARRTAIVALIPFCSPLVLLGIPFGLWALVILSKDEVKEAFRVRQASERYRTSRAGSRS